MPHLRSIVWRARAARRYRRVSNRRVIETLDEFAGACGPEARVLEAPSGSPNAPPQPPRHLEPELHPVLADLLEPWPLQDLAAGVFPGARLETAYGVVVAPDGSVLGASAWDPDQLRASGVFDRQPRFRRRARGRQASLVTQFGGYFHWLTEALPRIAVLRRLGLGELSLIVPPALTPARHESLELLGADTWIPYDEGVTPDVLVWPRPPGHTGHPPRWACAWLREQVVGSDAPRTDARLYISRRDARSRRVVNEPEVIALLRRHGFDVVQPERMTFREQADLFSRAAVVVGPHGAGNANVLFSTGATLVEFFEPGYVNGCFYSLNQALGLPYWYLLGEREAQSDIRVPVDRLERVLDAVLHDARSREPSPAGLGE
jgi:capsular polysaccharide biosynthesis protein